MHSHSKAHSKTPKENDLIVFGEDWGGLPSSSQHLIKELAKDRKVLWINSIGLRQPKLNLRDLKRACSKLFSSVKSANRTAQNHKQNTPENLTVLAPKTLPAPKSLLARWIAKKWLKRQIISASEPLNLYQPILWISLPTAVDLIDELKPTFSLYYCGDDFSALAGVDHQTVNLREQALVEKADLILTASETLKQRFPENKTATITHGVDLDLFSSPVPRAEDLPTINRPIAGFYGSISEWLDIDLLETTIKQLPDWDFVFIGKIVVNVDKLKQYKNVYFLGPKPHDELPRYSQHWQVALLPFIDNAQIRACNPLKLREYLAAGKPIISTDFKAIEAYRTLIKVVKNPLDLTDAIANSIKHADAYKMRLAIKEESWQAKAHQVEKLLHNLQSHSLDR